MAAPSQRGVRAGNVRCRHAACGGTTAGRVPGKAPGLEFMAGRLTNHLPRLGEVLLKQQCISSCYSDPCVYLGLRFLFLGYFFEIYGSRVFGETVVAKSSECRIWIQLRHINYELGDLSFLPHFPHVVSYLIGLCRVQ